MSDSKKKVLIIGAFSGSLINFRGELIKTIAASDCFVYAMASNASQEEKNKIEELGATYIDYPISRSSLNPFSDLKTLLSLRKTIADLKPDVVLAYTIKPVIWSGIAMILLRRIRPRFYALITGLGYTFHGQGFKRQLLKSIVKTLYRCSLSRSDATIFQNPDNRDVFIHHNILKYDKTSLVNGSGVDLDFFDFSQARSSAPLVFLTIARLLGEKGIREYAQAAAMLKKRYPDVKFQVLGPQDSSPDAIPMEELDTWVKNGDIEYLGNTSDVRPYIQSCSVYVLASYHEGMPRSVLEAMSMGRPIITTNVPGCRETIVDNKNGFLVDSQEVAPLAERMEWFIQNPENIATMGKQSRLIAEEKYDVVKVNHSLINMLGLNND